MSKEYYKKLLVDLRYKIDKEKEAKKKDNENYTRLIKGTSSSYNKAMYKRNKIDRAAQHDRRIAELKRDVERTKDAIKRS